MSDDITMTPVVVDKKDNDQPKDEDKDKDEDNDEDEDEDNDEDEDEDDDDDDDEDEDDDDSSSGDDDDSSSGDDDLPIIAKIKEVGGGGEETSSDDDCDEKDKIPLIKQLVAGSAVKPSEKPARVKPECEFLSFPLLDRMHKAGKRLVDIKDVASMVSKPETNLDSLMIDCKNRFEEALERLSDLIILLDGLWKEQDNIENPKSKFNEVKCTDDNDSDDDVKMEEEEDQKEARYESAIMEGLDLRTLPSVAWNRVKGRDLDDFEKHVLSVIKDLPAFKVWVWHYQACELARQTYSAAIHLHIAQAQASRAFAFLPGQFDLETALQRSREVGEAYVLCESKTQRIGVNGAVNVFKKMLTSVFLVRPGDAYENHLDEAMLINITSLKWLCLIEYYLRYDLAEACRLNIILYTFLDRVLSPSELNLDPRAVYDGGQQHTLRDLVLRASRHTASGHPEKALMALCTVFNEKSSSLNAAINHPPADAKEMKDKSLLYVLVHAHPDLSEALLHPCIELPTELLDSVSVGIRLRTLKHTHAILLDSKSEWRRECESSVTAFEQEFKNTGIKWDQLSADGMLSFIKYCKHVEKAVDRLFRYVEAGLVTTDEHRSSIAQYIEHVRPHLVNPDVSCLTTGRSSMTASFNANIVVPLEPFHTRLAKANADAEMKDIAEHESKTASGVYKRKSEAGEVNSSALDATNDSGAQVARAMQEFARLRATRSYLASTSRFDSLRKTEYQKLVAGAARNQRYQARVERQKKHNRDTEELPGDDEQPPRKRVKSSSPIVVIEVE